MAGTPVWLGFVSVDDVSQAVPRAVELGANVRLRRQADVMGGNVAVIVDPIGAAIALVSWDFEAAQ